jgi:hypothetical protein
MPSSRQRLHEVLEEEYVSMYGPLPAPEKPLETEEERLAHVYDEIHKRGNRTALCISGGGIRSATFALGVIQGLASAGILKRFDYLSTVSGGGFIGSWLSSWIRRHEKGVAGVESDLQRTDAGVAAHQAHSTQANVVWPTTYREQTPRKIDPEPAPVRHLRDYSNYLSPKLGILSGDSWTMGSLYVRNLMLNLLVIIPILAFALAIPRLFSWGLNESRFVPALAWPWVFAGLATLGFAYIGWTRPVERVKDKASKKRFETTDGRFMALCIVPLLLAAAALAIFWARMQRQPSLGGRKLSLEQLGLAGQKPTLLALGLAVAGMTLVPFLIYYVRVFRARGASFSKAFWRTLGGKLLSELGATVAALITSFGLLYLLAAKVFYDPLRLTPGLDKLSPLQRLGIPSSPHAQLFLCFAVPAILLVFFVQGSIFVGLSGRKNEDYDREWWGRAGAWLLFFAAAVGLLSFISVFGPIALYNAPVILGSIGGGAGVAAALLGFSDKTSATDKKKEEGGKTAMAGNLASALIVPLFVVFLLAAISLASTWLIQQQTSRDKLNVDTDKVEYALPAALQVEFTGTTTVTANGKPFEQKNKLAASPLLPLAALRSAQHLEVVKSTTSTELLAFAGLALIAWILSYRIGVNRFSMAALYRNRLIRAYLGASRVQRKPNPFTGFDGNDNLQMWQLRPEMVAASDIPDASGFVAAVAPPTTTRDGKTATATDPREALAQHLRSGLNAAVMAEPVDDVALAQNLNDLLLTTEFPGSETVAWIQSPAAPAQTTYDRTFRNRAVLDHYFGRWIRPMAAPQGVKPTPPIDPNALPRLQARPPLHVINTALNLTTGDDLAWQQRQAESMTISPYHCGNLRLGYRPSREYGGDDGISLGTAVGISGAAASPNMGYHSSPLMAFLLTFFNVRLGAWLGNPGKAGEESYKEGHPYTSLKPMLDELTGSSNDKSPWVYLSDGGHFDNLGLYEMIIRRCHYIVVSDAGADSKFSFEDLGSAIRKIRTDFGVPIEFADKMEMAARPGNGKLKRGRYVAKATIRYRAVDGSAAKDGTLIYIKAGIYNEPTCPRDVYNYAQESPFFPHEPTSDQFFSESQFESYRALGRHAVNEICGNYPVAAAPVRLPIAKTFDSVTTFFTVAENAAGPFPPGP